MLSFVIDVGFCEVGIELVIVGVMGGVLVFLCFGGIFWD